MEREKNIFSLIVKNSIFAFLKEKYPNYRFDDINDSDNISKITELLKQLEKYAHIPDKQHIISDNYNLIKSYIDNGTFKEGDFLQSLKENTQDLTEDDKNYILNAVIFITNEDNNISETEKEIILQISRFLDIHHSYKEILENYKKSEFHSESHTTIITIGIVLVLCVLGGLWYKINNIPKVQVFTKNEYQFDEITFNRYVIYKNQFKITDITNNISNKFKKYAVYYLSGTATVSFNPKDLQYDTTTQTLTVSNKFKIEPHISSKNIKTIDMVNPQKITKGEAQAIGTVVGLAGAYGGSKVGSSLGSGLTSFLPSSVQQFSTSISGLAGELLGGGVGYFATTKLLTGKQISANISQSDKIDTINTGIGLIKIQLNSDKKLLAMYKEHFETFIKAQYAKFGMNINHIKYTNNGEI